MEAVEAQILPQIPPPAQKLPSQILPLETQILSQILLLQGACQASPTIRTLLLQKVATPQKILQVASEAVAQVVQKAPLQTAQIV